LFGNAIDFALQRNHSLFNSNNRGFCLAVFFVQPFEAFDDLFKF
jgi:hypothetical protein